MNEVIEIVAARDNLSWREAEAAVMDVVEQFRAMTEEHNFNLEEYEDLLREELELEPDYLPALLFEVENV